jgi:hypothetical protein
VFVIEIDGAGRRPTSKEPRRVVDAVHKLLLENVIATADAQGRSPAFGIGRRRAWRPAVVNGSSNLT